MRTDLQRSGSDRSRNHIRQAPEDYLSAGDDRLRQYSVRSPLDEEPAGTGSARRQSALIPAFRPDKLAGLDPKGRDR
jgi:hypothetical protein